MSSSNDRRVGTRRSTHHTDETATAEIPIHQKRRRKGGSRTHAENNPNEEVADVNVVDNTNADQAAFDVPVPTSATTVAASGIDEAVAAGVRMNTDGGGDMSEAAASISSLPPADQRYQQLDPLSALDAAGRKNFVRAQRNESREKRRDDGIAQLLDVEQLVRQQVATLIPGAKQGDRLLSESEVDEKFVLRGNSVRVENPEWTKNQTLRSLLLARQGFVQRQEDEYQRLFRAHRDRFPSDAPRSFELQEERRRRLIADFIPPFTITLLKTSSEVIAINKEWREMEANVISQVFEAFTAFTKTQPGAPAAETVDDGVVAELVRTIVAPVLLRYGAQAQTSTFEDMPLTLERLRFYFFTYLTKAVLRLVSAPTTKKNALPEPPPGDVSASSDNLFASDVNSIGEGFQVDHDTLPTQEDAQLAYYASAIALFANRDYSKWFREWVGEFQMNFPEVVALSSAPSIIEKMRQFVRDVVNEAESRARRTARSPSHPGVPTYFRAAHLVPMREYAERFRTLLFTEIALARINAIVPINDVIDAIRAFLVNETQTTYALFRVVTNDYYEIVNRVRDEELDGALDDAERAMITLRADAIKAQIGQLWREGTKRYEHSPAPSETIKAADDASWAPTNLAYPLDRRRSLLVKSSLQSAVAILAREFDAEAKNVEAASRREALDAHYIDQVIRRDLAQLSFLLNEVLTPLVEAPLALRCNIASRQTIKLAVRLELAPLVASRVVDVDDSFRTASDRAILAELHQQRFACTWYRRGREVGASETVVRQSVLRRINQQDVLVINETGAIDLGIVGVYRAEVQQLDPADETKRVGPIYKSLFAATIDVYARCVRDGVEFLPTKNDNRDRFHGECEWHEHAHTPEFQEQLEDLVTLTSYGVDVLQERIAERTKVSTRQTLDVLPLALARHVRAMSPWGSSTMQHLTALSHQTAVQRHKLFTIDTLVPRFLQRVAAVDLALNGNSRQGLAVLAQAVVDGNGTNLLSMAPEQGAVDDVATFNADVAPQTLLRNKVLGATRATNDADRAHFVGLDKASGGWLAVPFQTLISLLKTPTALALATPREQSYFEKIDADFAMFAHNYRAMRTAQENGENGGWFYVNAAQSVQEQFQKMVTAELAKISLQAIRTLVQTRMHDVIAIGKLFVDERSETELANLLDKNDALPKRDIMRVAPTKLKWRGSHTAHDSQPSMARIDFVQVLSADRLTNRLNLVIVQRGSEPEARGYDYNGLHNLIDTACKRYNGEQAKAAPSQSALEYWAAQAGRAVTIYNYFAFLAERLSEQSFMSAEEIVRRIDAQVYTNITFDPTPISSTLMPRKI